jgi:hypothetical protein
MFKERKSSFRKNMAILVCAAFIFMVFPEVTYAATKPSSKRFQFPEEFILFISTVFSFASPNSSPLGYDLGFICSLSRNKPKLPRQARNGQGIPNGQVVQNDQGDQDSQGDQNGQEQNGLINGHGNSTSKKKPKGKGDD